MFSFIYLFLPFLLSFMTYVCLLKCVPVLKIVSYQKLASAFDQILISIKISQKIFRKISCHFGIGTKTQVVQKCLTRGLLSSKLSTFWLKTEMSENVKWSSTLLSSFTFHIVHSFSSSWVQTVCMAGWLCCPIYFISIHSQTSSLAVGGRKT